MKLLVVGGAGYVGTIIRDALETEHICYHFDRRPVPGKARSIIGDVTDFARVWEAVKGMDGVLYMPLASIPGTRRIEDKKLCFDVQALGLYHFLEAGLEQRVRRFYFTSTLNVYTGRQMSGREGPLTETMVPRCFIPYGLSKRVGEFIAEAACQTYPKASVLAVRLCLPRQEQDWRGVNEIMTGPNDVRRLFLAMLRFNRPGFHVANASGDLTGEKICHDGIHELIGWRPEGN